MKNLSDKTVPPQDPLLTTKLYIPPLRRNLVPRPRLTTRLNRGVERALTLISAPPGFGKTTLLSEWIQQTKDEGGGMKDEVGKLHPSKIVWLSLDEADNDPARFLSYFITALQAIQTDVGQTALATLQAGPAQTPPAAGIETLLPSLVNEIAAIPHDFVLILDDYHVIHTEAIHAALAGLLDHMPLQMHLVMASRSTPPLPLPRLRVRGQLLELGTADLRFTPDEAATFLNQVMRLNLSSADVAALETRTEGWIAGLQMAALSMQDCEDIPGFLASFTGSHRYVFDYLAEEVLQQQPQHIQTFLLQTSILNRLTAPLCVTMFDTPPLAGEQGEGASQTILEYLEQANLFIIPLDEARRWYRYHHLFADFLRDRLQRQIGAPGVADLHRRAAAWYEKNDLTAEAMGHALTVADVERAVRLVEQSGGAMLRQSELSTLLHWLEVLPEEVVRNRPRLSLFHAWALVFTGQLEAVEAWLQDAEHALSPTSSEVEGHVLSEVEGTTDIPGETTAIRATVAYFQRDIPRAIALYCQAFERLPEENLFLRGAVALSLATAYNIQGDIAGAKWAFAQAGTISEANSNIYVSLIATWNLAQLHIEQGQLHRAAELYRRALVLATQQVQQGGMLPPITGRVYVGLGQVLYQWNDLNTAAHHLLEGLKLGRQSGEVTTLMSGHLALARVKQAQADTSGALETLGEAEKFAQQNNLPSWGIRLAAHRVRLWLAQNDLTAAERWLQKDWLDLSSDSADDSAGYPHDLRQVEQLAQARLLIAQNKAGKALALLVPLHQMAEAKGRTGCVLEILLLQALAHQAQDDAAQAMVMLEKALILAERDGHIRLFVDEGPPMAELLAKMKADETMREYVRQLLAAFAKEKTVAPSSVLIEPLSDRELEILHLIAAGSSNQQIAAELVLTVGTVKWHLSNIYSKLGVNSRTQAVAQARELRLL